MKPIPEQPYRASARYWMRQAIARAGTQKHLAANVGVTQQYITFARKTGRVSGELAVRIHHWSAGEIPAHRMRPDLWTAAEHVPPRPPIGPVIVHPVVVRGSS